MMNLFYRWTTASAVMLCTAGTVSAANPVDAFDREWLPLTTLTNFSWLQIDAVCQSDSEAPGACNGVLGDVDLTGWTWASRTEVVALIGEFMAAAGDDSSPDVIRSPHGYGTNAHDWAPAIIDAFGTTAAPLGAYAFGFTNGGQGDFAWVCHGAGCGWSSYGAANEVFGGNSDFYGAWFYRAVPVPEPSAVALMLAGVALLGVRLRRRNPLGGRPV